jgi:hypothetical protein
MSEFVAFLGALGVLAARLSPNTDRFGRLRCEAVNGIPSELCVQAEVCGREPSNPPAPRREQLPPHLRQDRIRLPQARFNHNALERLKAGLLAEQRHQASDVHPSRSRRLLPLCSLAQAPVRDRIDDATRCARRNCSYHITRSFEKARYPWCLSPSARTSR